MRQSVTKPVLMLFSTLILAACNAGGSGNDSANNNDGDGAGAGGGSAGNVTAFAPVQYFIGNDGSAGVLSSNSDPTQLWITNGTESGTRMVKDLFPGDDANLQSLTVVGDKLFFTADDGDGFGEQLWVTDGTEANTARLTSVNMEGGSAARLTALGNTLYFRARSAGTNNPRLWRSDGTAAGTLVVNPDAEDNFSFSILTALGAHVYFDAPKTDIGWELWRSDGTAANTIVFADLQANEPGTIGSMYTCPDDLTVMNNHLYFSATDDTSSPFRCSLWRTDGVSQPEKIKLFEPNTTMGPKHMVASGDQLFFFSGKGATADFQPLPAQLWVTDGTSDGTRLVRETDDDFTILTNLDNPLVATNDHAYFYMSNKAVHQSSSLELWYSDGTDTGLVQVLDDGIGRTAGLTKVTTDEYLYYSAKRPPNGDPFLPSNRLLWQADGANTKIVYSRERLSIGAPLVPVEDGETVLFGVAGTVWRTNGTEGGTVAVKEICQPVACKGFLDY